MTTPPSPNSPNPPQYPQGYPYNQQHNPQQYPQQGVPQGQHGQQQNWAPQPSNQGGYAPHPHGVAQNPFGHQGWAPEPPKKGMSKGLLAVLIGGGCVFLIAIAVALFLVFRGGDDGLGKEYYDAIKTESELEQMKDSYVESPVPSALDNIVAECAEHASYFDVLYPSNSQAYLVPSLYCKTEADRSFSVHFTQNTGVVEYAKDMGLSKELYGFKSTRGSRFYSSFDSSDDMTTVIEQLKGNKGLIQYIIDGDESQAASFLLSKDVLKD